MLLCFVMAAGLGWFARGATLGSADAAPTVAVKRLPLPEIHCPTAPPADDSGSADGAGTANTDVAASDDDTEPNPDDENTGDDLGDLIAKANAATETHNGVHGHVSDTQTGAPVPGVTVLVTGNGVAQSAYTSEDGDYTLRDLDAGTYMVSFYYGNVSTEHANITINSFDSIAVDEHIDTAGMYRDREQYVFEGE
jgi:5-hydroxyisourate hydrolase-like protein (transthyretin family)